MKHIKEIVISLPDSVLTELEKLAEEQNKTVSDFISGLIRRECFENSKSEEEMAEGYRQMGDLNLELAEAFLQAEEETLNWYEEKLSECEQN